MASLPPRPLSVRSARRSLAASPPGPPPCGAPVRASLTHTWLLKRQRAGDAALSARASLRGVRSHHQTPDPCLGLRGVWSHHANYPLIIRAFFSGIWWWSHHQTPSRHTGSSALPQSLRDQLHRSQRSAHIPRSPYFWVVFACASPSPSFRFCSLLASA